MFGRMKRSSFIK